MTVPQVQSPNPASHDAGSRPRSRAALITLAACAMLVFIGLGALGTWQLFRLQWKLDLIDRVEHRVHAPPAQAPSPAQWPLVRAATDEYRHVRLSGTFLYDKTTPVQATTELGFGYWLLTPLRVEDGSLVLINRGFVSADRLALALATLPNDTTGDQSRTVTSVTVTGLLRMPEPGGAFLRHNDPAGNRWYSRDVQAIAAAQGLPQVAPYFVDADASPPSTTPAAPGEPIGGLTVVSFHNNHLAYALTWYALALMVAGAAFWAVREEKRIRLGTVANRASSDRDSVHGNRHGNQ